MHRTSASRAGVSFAIRAMRHRLLALATILTLAVFAAGCSSGGNGSSGNAAGSDPPPAAGNLSSASGAVGSTVTITGSGFGSTQGASTVTFNGVSAGTADAWSDTSITVTVPTGASTGDIVVHVAGDASNGLAFQVVYTCANLPALGNEDVLRGNFLVSFDGFADSAGTPSGTGPFQLTGVFAVNGAGSITAGEADADFVYLYPGSLLSISGGCYNLGSDQRGTMIWNFATGGSFTFAIAMHSNGLGGRLILFQDFTPGSTTDYRGSGDFTLQSLGSFSEADLAGAYTFRLAGAVNSSTSTVPSFERLGIVGSLTFAGIPLGGLGDADVAAVVAAAQANFDGEPIYASPTAPDAMGRGTLLLEVGGSAGAALCAVTGDICNYNLSYYIAGGGQILLQGLGGTTNAGTEPAIFNGLAAQQSGPFTAGILNGTSVLTVTGEQIVDHGYAVEAAGQVSSNGGGPATVYLDKESNGNTLYVGTTEIPGGSFTVNANGLGTLVIGSGSSAQYFDLAMVSQNTAFVLEGTEANPGTNLMIGMLTPQTVTSTLSTAHLFEFAPVYPATTNVNVFTGSATPTATSLSGTMDTSAGLSCTTGCLSANQPFTGTYTIDANGRISLDVTSAGGGGFVGWLANATEFSGFIPQTDASMIFFEQ